MTFACVVVAVHVAVIVAAAVDVAAVVAVAAVAFIVVVVAVGAAFIQLLHSDQTSQFFGPSSLEGCPSENQVWTKPVKSKVSELRSKACVGTS